MFLNLEGPMIKPTVGRVVWFTPSRNAGIGDGVAHYDNQPHAAMVVYVWNDYLVNLVVYGHDGVPHPKTSVPLIQEDGVAKPEFGYYAEWMPYQIGQAKAHAP